MLGMKIGPVMEPSSYTNNADYIANLGGQEKLDLNKLLVKNQETICIQMQGDAMQGIGIWHGDILVVNRKTKQFSGKVAVVKLKKRLLIRRLYKTSSEILLMPANRNYEPIKSTKPIEDILWGIVDCVIRKV